MAAVIRDQRGAVEHELALARHAAEHVPGAVADQRQVAARRAARRLAVGRAQHREAAEHAREGDAEADHRAPPPVSWTVSVPQRAHRYRAMSWLAGGASG